MGGNNELMHRSKAIILKRTLSAEDRASVSSAHPEPPSMETLAHHFL